MPIQLPPVILFLPVLACPVFIPPAASTCQLFMGLASPNGPWRTACQPFGLLCEGGTAWEAFEVAVDRTLVHR